MSVTISPQIHLQFFTASGVVASGYQLFTYQAGTSIKQATWTDSTQSTQNANPLQLDSQGRAYVWPDPTLVYKYVLALPTDTDPPQSPVETVDNVQSPINLSNITQALIGTTLYPRTAAEIAAGVTPVQNQYVPYHAWRYLTAIQVADVMAGTLTQDCTTGLQNWLNASIGQNCIWPSGSYLISSQLNGGNCRIYGDVRNYVKLVYTGTATIAGGGSMLQFTNVAGLHIENVQFVCTNIGSSNFTTQIHLTNAVNCELAAIVVGGSNATSVNIGGILIDQNNHAAIPPYGNIVLRNILAVVEPTSVAAVGSVGVHIKGDPLEPMVNIMMTGEASVEHWNAGVKLENVNGGILENWEFRGSSATGDTSIQLVNSNYITIISTTIAPQPTIGTGISMDSNSNYNTIINPTWNFSSGNPAAAITDNGTGNTIIAAQAVGTLTPVSKLPGAWLFTKPDGIAPNIKVTRTTTDTESCLQLQSDYSPPTAAWVAIDRGSLGSQDILRLSVNGTLYERIDANCQHYFLAPNSAPSSANLANSQVTMWLDEVGNNIKFECKLSGGAVKTGTLAIS